MKLSVLLTRHVRGVSYGVSKVYYVRGGVVPGLYSSPPIHDQWQLKVLTSQKNNSSDG